MQPTTLDKAAAFFGRHRLTLIFGAVYLVLSLYVMVNFLHNSRLGDVFYRTQFDAMMAGKAWRPFVYRILVPRMVVTVDELTPVQWRVSAEQNFKRWLQDTRAVKAYLPWMQELYEKSTYRKLVATALLYACLWGYIVALYYFARHLFPADPAIRYFAPVFGLFVLPSFSWQWLYIYDIPVLLLSTLCYHCIATRRLALYFIPFTLACLNKESAIFILLFFAIWFAYRMKPLEFAMLVAAQCVIFMLTRLMIYQIYVDNVGFVLEDNVYKVLIFDLLNKSRYFQIVAVAAIFFLLTFRWQDKPQFLKQGLWLLPPFYLAYIMYGWPGEYRVFFDIMPFGILLLTHTLVAGTGISQSPVFANPLRREAPHDPMA